MLALGVNRHPGEHHPGRSAQILTQGRRQQLDKDLEGRPVVQLKDEVAVGLGDGVDRADWLTRLRDADRIGKIATQQGAAHGVVADRIAAQLEGFANAAVLGRPAADGLDRPPSGAQALAQALKKGAGIEIIGVRKHHQQVFRPAVGLNTGRNLLAGFLAPAAQLGNKEAFGGKRVGPHGEHRNPGRPLHLLAGHQHTAGATAHHVGGLGRGLDRTQQLAVGGPMIGRGKDQRQVGAINRGLAEGGLGCLTRSLGRVFLGRQTHSSLNHGPLLLPLPTGFSQPCRFPASSGPAARSIWPAPCSRPCR